MGWTVIMVHQHNRLVIWPPKKKKKILSQKSSICSKHFRCKVFEQKFISPHNKYTQFLILHWNSNKEFESFCTTWSNSMNWYKCPNQRSFILTTEIKDFFLASCKIFSPEENHNYIFIYPFHAMFFHLVCVELVTSNVYRKFSSINIHC